MISLSNALNNGFSVELIHRDSSKSPLYQPTQNKYQRVVSAMRRSINRVDHFYNHILTNTPKSIVIPTNGEYLMTYSVGTPPFKLYGIVDTGSDLVWLQSKPCEHCYNQTTPIFNPLKSSSYKNIHCLSKKCKSFESTSCNKKKTCEYTIIYDDRSISQGDLSLETLTLDFTSGSSISFPKTVIGFGHKNTMSFEGKSSGVVGLGNGPVSLINQLGSSIGGKFSYCLGSESSNSTSKLNFGEAAIVSGHGVVSTPLVKKDPQIFYLITLKAFSVGNKRVEFAKQSNGSVDGNIMVDSGTTLTTVPSGIYHNLESVVVKLVKLKRAKDPIGGIFNLCYSDTSNKYDFPIITAHFEGADVKLHSISIFVPVADGVVCLALVPSRLNEGTFGNLAQQNLLVGYDLQQKIMSFKPTDCTKQY